MRRDLGERTNGSSLAPGARGSAPGCEGKGGASGLGAGTGDGAGSGAAGETLLMREGRGVGAAGGVVEWAPGDEGEGCGDDGSGAGADAAVGDWRSSGKESRG